MNTSMEGMADMPQEQQQQLLQKIEEMQVRDRCALQTQACSCPPKAANMHNFLDTPVDMSLFPQIPTYIAVKNHWLSRYS